MRPAPDVPTVNHTCKAVSPPGETHLKPTCSGKGSGSAFPDLGSQLSQPVIGWTVYPEKTCWSPNPCTSEGDCVWREGCCTRKELR